MKKEEVPYIMDIIFDGLVNFIQSELQTQNSLLIIRNCVPWIIGSPRLALWLKQMDFIGELIRDTILNLLTKLMLLFQCHLEYVKFGIMYNYKKCITAQVMGIV